MQRKQNKPKLPYAGVRLDKPVMPVKGHTPVGQLLGPPSTPAEVFLSPYEAQQAGSPWCRIPFLAPAPCGVEKKRQENGKVRTRFGVEFLPVQNSFPRPLIGDIMGIDHVIHRLQLFTTTIFRSGSPNAFFPASASASLFLRNKAW